MSETKPFAELEVPGEPGVYWCARHTKVQTRLRCGRCEKPICPKCTKIGPTGARCPDCYSNRDAHIFQVAPWQLAAAFIVSMVLSAIAITLVQGLFILVFFAPVVGTFLGKVVTTITRGKRGSRLAIAASAGTILGAIPPMLMNLIAARALVAAINPNINDPSSIITQAIIDAGCAILYLALAIPAMWWWIK